MVTLQHQISICNFKATLSFARSQGLGCIFARLCAVALAKKMIFRNKIRPIGSNFFSFRTKIFDFVHVEKKLEK